MTALHRTLPTVQANYQLIVDGRATNHIYEGQVPEELMDAYEQVVGNGLAKVSVSADMGIKDFGTGASAMVSITLTCNQDEKTIDRAIELASTLARGYAQEHRQRAENELQAILTDRKARQEAGMNRNPNYR
jgi:hypothetical protein